MDHYLWDTESHLRVACFGRPGLRTELTLFLGTRRKKKFYLLRQCIFFLHNSPSRVLLVGYLMHSGICKNMTTSPFTVDGIYCLCLNLHSLCLKPHPRMSVYHRIHLFIKQKQRSFVLMALEKGWKN